VVVGGGFIGLEMVENLVHRGLEVTLIEKLNQVMPPTTTARLGFVTVWNPV
jgi:NADPH-dependent 2,4-dienoyl-CoA reductase/sulfur reductase-like enzyme